MRLRIDQRGAMTYFHMKFTNLWYKLETTNIKGKVLISDV